MKIANFTNNEKETVRRLIVYPFPDIPVKRGFGLISLDVWRYLKYLNL